MRRVGAFVVICAFLLACNTEKEKQQPVAAEKTAAPEEIETYGMGKAWLSEYGFFEGKLADLQPADNVVAYELNTPLFSDYAHKKRFIYFPEGAPANYQEREVLDFPVGTVLIKNFYYPNDFRDASAGKKILETRLLVHEEKGWQPLSYIWNEEQTDAYFEIIGATIPVQWTHDDGAIKQTNYIVPNLNQCKSCHVKDKTLMPIGPTARQLNRKNMYVSEEVNQLEFLAANGLLSGLPEAKERPAFPLWDNPNSGTLDERAIAYLDINCGPCHNPLGPAKTSGLNLTVFETDPFKLGFMKPPVAAGKASGNLLHDIVPGKPEASILLHRMNSTNPEVMMPELGRTLIHEEGVALIRKWIEQLNSSETVISP
ncbi:SO2930 family diheme c-type cytochrome [Catalinimonas alkaloidigena]|uniref:SO2930 family diheme c-type cytochrome n=1 Tax=Catalinimonas alkaloidigena TaxID=1075417 RepID=UPI0024072FF8|nr:SO2930 family diheme c-type cytochrome [Catalinimonas alkaloidigena]